MAEVEVGRARLAPGHPEPTPALPGLRVEDVVLGVVGRDLRRLELRLILLPAPGGSSGCSARDSLLDTRIGRRCCRDPTCRSGGSGARIACRWPTRLRPRGRPPCASADASSRSLAASSRVAASRSATCVRGASSLAVTCLADRPDAGALGGVLPELGERLRLAAAIAAVLELDREEALALVAHLTFLAQGEGS